MMTAAMDGENDGQIRLTITITQPGQAGWNGKVELAAGTKVQQSENPAHMQMTRGKVWGLGRDVGPQANGEGTMRGGPW